MGLLGSLGGLAGTAIGGPIGGMIGSGIGDLVSGGISSALDYRMNLKQQRELMAEQYKYKRKEALESPGWRVQGLRDAGLNPILAATGAGGLGGSSGGVSVSGNTQYGSQAINSASALKNLDLMSATEDKIKQESNTSKAQEEVAKATANQIREQTRSSKRENDFADSRPDIYEQSKIKDAGNGFVGQLVQGAGILERLFGTGYHYNPNSAKSFRRGYFYEDSK